MKRGCCVYGKWEDLENTELINDFKPTGRSYHAIDGVWYLWIGKHRKLNIEGFDLIPANINLCEEHHYQCLLEFLGKSTNLSV